MSLKFKEDGPPCCGWASSNQLKTEQNIKVDFPRLLLTALSRDIIVVILVFCLFFVSCL